MTPDIFRLLVIIGILCIIVYGLIVLAIPFILIGIKKQVSEINITIKKLIEHNQK